uniref:Cytochrome c oxidase subunit 2 n=1 Tax=Microdiplogynium sp. XFX TaxID=2695875 RepID=A0A6B9WH34_9ACAR|nr:cytochrome oxidase subunit 2 [Microdiplogynium sp. XFX]
MMTWANIMFPNANSPIMEQLLYFHDHSMIIIILITIMITYIMINTLMNKFSSRFILEGQEIETVWTILPALMLIFIALPSLKLLYMMEETFNPSLTLKIIGHQWYWSYEYSNFNIEFDSFMIPETEMNPNHFRLLDVDNRVILPFKLNIRFLITAADVIHSWTIPSLGIKVDAVPGRINQLFALVTRPGIFYGQCSEICGANHSFMPISLEFTSQNNFINWLMNY